MPRPERDCIPPSIAIVVGAAYYRVPMPKPDNFHHVDGHTRSGRHFGIADPPTHDKAPVRQQPRRRKTATAPRTAQVPSTTPRTVQAPSTAPRIAPTPSTAPRTAPTPFPAPHLPQNPGRGARYPSGLLPLPGANHTYQSSSSGHESDDYTGSSSGIGSRSEHSSRESTPSGSSDDNEEDEEVEQEEDGYRIWSNKHTLIMLFIVGSELIHSATDTMPRLMKTRPTRTLTTSRLPSNDNSCRLLPHQYVTTTTTATLHTTSTRTKTTSGCPVSSPDFEWIWDVADPRRVFFEPTSDPASDAATTPGGSVDSRSSSASAAAAQSERAEQLDQADLSCQNTVDRRKRRYARLWHADRAPGHPLAMSAEQLAHISARIDDAAAAVVGGGVFEGGGGGTAPRGGWGCGS